MVRLLLAGPLRLDFGCGVDGPLARARGPLPAACTQFELSLTACGDRMRRSVRRAPDNAYGLLFARIVGRIDVVEPKWSGVGHLHDGCLALRPHRVWDHRRSVDER